MNTIPHNRPVTCIHNITCDMYALLTFVPLQKYKTSLEFFSYSGWGEGVASFPYPPWQSTTLLGHGDPIVWSNHDEVPILGEGVALMGKIAIKFYIWFWEPSSGDMKFHHPCISEDLLWRTSIKVEEGHTLDFRGPTGHFYCLSGGGGKNQFLASSEITISEFLKLP